MQPLQAALPPPYSQRMPCHQFCSTWTGLTHLDLGSVILHECRGALEALAAMPWLQRAALTFYAPPDGCWHVLRQLGSRLASLVLQLDAPYAGSGSDDESGAEQAAPARPPDWPAQLRGLPDCREMELIPHAEESSWPAGSLAGIELVPALRSINVMGDVPQQVWACRQLTCLLLQRAEVGAPGAAPEVSSARQLSNLQRLILLWCRFWRARFPSALCSLPALTSLHLYGCTLLSISAFPAEMSQLRCVQLGLRPATRAVTCAHALPNRQRRAQLAALNLSSMHSAGSVWTLRQPACSVVTGQRPLLCLQEPPAAGGFGQLSGCRQPTGAAAPDVPARAEGAAAA